MIVGLDHVSVLVADVPRALAFYQGILGLTCLSRPNLGFDGVWLDLGQSQSLHLLCLPNPDSGRVAPAHAGRDRHLALRTSDIENVRLRLANAGVPITLSQSGRASIFCRDPDGNGVELMPVS